MKKKLLGILLTAILAVCAFTLCAGAATTISTADALIELMNDSTAWSGDYVLGKSIDLSTYTGEKSQIPIGNGTTKFTGTFDGKGYTISGVNIVSSERYVAFFGFGDGCTVKNLTLKGTIESTYTTTGTPRGSGGIMAVGRNVTISGCNNAINVTSAIECGGVLGYAYLSAANAKATITDCTNSGTINGATGAGGILGYAYFYNSSKTGCVVNVSGCTNTGAVSGTTGVAGIVGYVNFYKTSGGVFKVTDCVNKGIISASTYSGGVVGDIYTENAAIAPVATITGCENYGAVTLSGNVAGGILGYARLRVTTLANAGELILTNCANYATITAADYVGGIMGAYLSGNTLYAKATFENLYNEGNLVANYTAATYSKAFAGGFAGLLRPSYLLDSATSTELPVVVKDIYTKGTTTYKGATFGSAAIGTLGESKETPTMTISNVYTEGANIILSCDTTSSADGVLVYNNKATPATTKTTVKMINTFVGTDTDVSALGAEANWVQRGDSVSLISFTAPSATINSAKELAVLMRATKFTKWAEYLANDYTLTADVDLTGIAHDTIGDADVAFTGSFDGGNNEVSGFDVSTGTIMGTGFFGHADGATIRNLTVTGTVHSTGSRAGGIVGEASGDVTIDNCISNVTVTASNGACAGIVGTFNLTTGADLKITNCTNNKDITASAYNAGIVGYIYGSAKNYTLLIDNCVNNGNITNTSTSSNYAGGILGYGAGSATSGTNSITIKNSANYGMVTANKYAGGIAGGIAGTTNLKYAFTFTMDNCYNEGDIVGDNSGGILGFIRPAVTTAGTEYVITDVMSKDSTGKAIVGGFGSGSSTVTATYAFTRAYSVNAEQFYEYQSTTNFTFDETGSYISTATADELNALAANEKWVGSAEYGVELASFHNHTPIYVIDGANGHSSFCLCLDESQNTALTPHTFDELDVCTACGYTDCKHPAADYVVTLPATCLATGLKDFVCPTCETVLEKDEEIPVDANNHAERGVYMVVNETSVNYLHDCCDVLAVSDTTLSTTIYVSTTGNDLSAGVTAPVGYTAETAFKNFKDAMVLAAAVANIKDTDVTIQIVDKATIATGSYTTPAYENMITITGGELAFTDAATRFFQSGDVTVRDVEFNNAAAVVWVARGNKVVMDTGLTHASTQYMYVLGGWQSGTAAEFNPDVTVRSGDWYCVAGGNRQQGTSNACVTNGTITLGTVNETDTLTIKNFYPFHMGGGNISADSTVTVVVDGKVNITDTFHANIQTGSDAVGAEHTYTVNYVLKQNAVVTRSVGFTNVEHSTIVWNVYADQRSDAAKTEAARIVGTNNITVNQYTYVQYCFKVLGGHFGEGENCTECGGPRECNHEGTGKTWKVVTPSTCNVKGIEKEVCSLCENDTGVTRELDLVATNHKDNTNWAWTQNTESGAYEILCSECGSVYCSQTELPTVYLANFSTVVGDDANDGLTTDTAVKTLVEAVNRIKNVGGTVAIVKGYSLGAEHVLPEWNGTITFTSATFDSNGAATAGFNITKHNVELHLGGKAVFDDILFKGTSRKNAVNGSTTYTSDVFRAIISCHWHDVDFGYIRVQQYATIYLVAGEYGITASDTTPATTKMTVDGPALSDNALPYFFERIYLGSVFSKGDLEVSNKTVTLEVENGHINSKATKRDREALVYTIYSMSTTGTNAYGSSTTNGCTSTVTLKDDSSVVAFRTGDRNVSYDKLTNGKTGDELVEYGPSKGKLDNLKVNLLGNSQITDVEENTNLAVTAATGSFQVKNTKNVIVNVSTVADGRTEKLIHSLNFYKYGTFAEEEATLTVNGGTHSFIPTIAKCVNAAAAASGKRPYTVLKDLVDECTYEGEITTEATPETDGVITYTCTVCGRKYTESYSYDCTDHNYVVALDGRYYCANDGEIVASPEADTIVALSPAEAKDGKVTVDVTVSANALWSALFSVNAPAGFELADVSSALDGDFTFVGADELALPYSMAIMGIGTDENGNLANNSIDNVVVTLTFNVTENVVGSKHVFTLALDHVYDVDGAEIGGEAVSAEVFACTHADTSVTTTATCTDGGVKTTVCNVCETVIETVEDGALGHDYESEVISTVSPTTPGVVRYTCKRCGDTYDDITLPAGSATLTAVAGQIADGKVSVELRLDADAVAAVLFSIDASAGLTLESISNNASDNFHLETTELSGMPCKVMLVNLEGTNVALDNALVATLVFAVDEDAMGENGEIILTAIECINADENDIYMHTVNGIVAHNCKYECVFVADTAEKDAHYLYTCTVCGDTYEVEAVAQEYTASYGSTVILESDLGLQIVANIADKITDVSKIWLIVDVTDASGNVTREVVNPYQAYPSNSQEGIFIYRFNAARISAKNIADDVFVTLCVEKDGVKYAAPTVKSNIISYYAAAKKASAPEVIMNALNAMMNYGAAAQEYFNYNTENLATTLTGAEKIDYATDTSVSVNASTTYGDENITTYTYKSLSAVLEDKVVMVIKYKGAAIDGLVFKGSYKDINGNDKTFEKAAVVKNGVVTVEVDVIAAKDLRQAFTGALYSGDEQVSSSITTSFESYATQAIEDINNSLLNAVCRAALAYSDAAANYFRAK